MLCYPKRFEKLIATTIKWAFGFGYRESFMNRSLLASAAVLALATGSAGAEQLTVFGPWLGPDQESVEAVLSDFAAKSGHDVSYVGSDSFEQQILVDAEAGSAPNIAVFPQPGLASDMASRGFLTPLADAPRQRCRRLGSGELRRWAVLGRPRHLCRRERQRPALRLLLQGRCEIPRLVRP